MRFRTFAAFALAFALISSPVIAQEAGSMPEASAGLEARAGINQSPILTSSEAAKILPANVFFRGQSASVQGRNSSGIRFADHTLLLVALIDTSGYSSQVKQKYQAYLITESPIEIDGHRLSPGAYGCGFLNGGFVVMDLGAHDLFTAKSADDTTLRRPRPLQIIAATGSDNAFRLYAGRTYVTIQTNVRGIR